MSEKLTTTIVIENLTESQLIAIKEFLCQWQFLGGIGSSRWTAFYADGDGNFRPKITIDGKPPENSDLAGGAKRRWRNTFSERDVYAIDFDTIAWALRGDKQ